MEDVAVDIKDIKRIIELAKENDLTEFELSEEGFRITIKRKTDGDVAVVQHAPVYAAPAAVHAPAPVAAPAAAAPVPAAAPSNLAEIKSPMVGTFYRSASPDAEPFVSVGKEVEPDTVVCIIEAMKVMNEIKAEAKGVIRKVCVENATSVEFGKPLFLVEPR
jgi:acetyl-CoA carboxylase biotin carboxyl carrier protein